MCGGVWPVNAAILHGGVIAESFKGLKEQGY
jgi:hypothetical protein